MDERVRTTIPFWGPGFVVCSTIYVRTALAGFVTWICRRNRVIAIPVIRDRQKLWNWNWRKGLWKSGSNFKFQIHDDNSLGSRAWTAVHRCSAARCFPARLKCHREGCTTWSSYGAEGTKKREFCRRHAGHGMVDVVSKMCEHTGCMKQATFGVWGRTRKFCAGHATEGTVRLKGMYQGAPLDGRNPHHGMAPKTLRLQQQRRSR